MTSMQDRILSFGNASRCLISRSCGERLKSGVDINNEKDESEENESRPSSHRAVAQHATSLILALSLAISAPMPVMAEWDSAILPTLPVSSTIQESPLVLADAAPYTGQLIDTSNAVVVRLDSGVTYNDLREGTGEDVAMEGKRVNIQWVLKRSNGYSIDSSAQNDGVPFIFVVGNSQRTESRAIPGLDEGIRGMKVGGIRRIVIPPSLAYVEGVGEDSPGPVPPGFGPKQRIKRVMENRMDVPDESFLLDVKLTRVQ